MLGVMAGCVSTHYDLHPDADLNDYRYVVLLESDYDPYEIHTELSSLFSNAGFAIISEAEKERLSLPEQRKLLFCIYEYAHAMMNIRVDIKLYNNTMETAIFAGKGEYGLGLDRKSNTMRAIEQAFWGISEKYSRF